MAAAHRRPEHLIGAVVIAMSLSGCAAAPQSQDAESANAEYREEAETLKLAPGWLWPTQPYLGHGPDGRGASYGIGIGRVDASFYWFCSWGRSLDDPNMPASTHSNVLAVDDTAFYRLGLDVDGQKYWQDEVLEPATNGDFEPMMETVELNCPLESDSEMHLDG